MSPSARRKPRFTASYIPLSFSTNTFTRASRVSQSSVPSSEPASCTMCSQATPWSATDATHSFSQSELRKLGVMTEKRTVWRIQKMVACAILSFRDRPDANRRRELERTGSFALHRLFDGAKHAAVQRHTQADGSAEREHIAGKSSENDKETDDFDDKKGQ